MAKKNTAEIHPMLINGKQVSGESKEFVEVVNPSDGEIVGKVPIASGKEIDAAVNSSYNAFKEWRETPAAERAGVIVKLVEGMRENIDDIAQVLTKEQGKPYPQAKGEIGGFCAVMEFYAQEARRITGMVLESDHRDRFDTPRAPQIAERNLIAPPFTLDRQEGLTLLGRLFPGRAADSRYAFGLFTGNGRAAKRA